MKIFQVYNERYFEGLVRNGLLNKDSGFKVIHNFPVPTEFKFNVIAAKGSKLYQMIKENNMPFYVDRLAGGTKYHKYDFDFDLIREYEDLLGDWFLGFQLHESASNRRMGDWKYILRQMGSKGPYDPAKLREALVSSYAKMPDGTPLFGLSQGTPESYAKLRYAETASEYLEEMRGMFRERMDEVDGHILPCDSYYLAMKMQDELGMKTFMPEVGSQIPLMRLAVAAARGTAVNKGKTWGTYYESWRYVHGKGCIGPSYNSDPSNEWYETTENFKDDFCSYGDKGGSSRLMQRRIYYYSLMSGADYMSEEYALDNCFNDLEDFELSSYGRVKKDFMDWALHFQGIRAVVPFAIVLPKDYSCIELWDLFTDLVIGKHRDTYLDSPLSAEEKQYFGHIGDVFQLIYARNGAVYGNEGHVITNSRFGDLFDVIYEDASHEVFERYEYLIDATREGSFIRAKEGSGLKVLASHDLEQLEAVIHKLAAEILPCTVDGLHWLLSTDGAGGRYLSIFNNEGNERCLEKGDILISEADARVKITFKEAVNPEVIRGFSEAAGICRVDDKTYYADVPAAGLLILKY